MMKSGKAVFVVDAVEEAVKFYTDKLAFDVVELLSDPNNRSLTYAQLRKGKCYVLFRTPHVDELVEFSQVKYCMSRGSGLFAEMKKGIEKYYARCKSKGVTIAQELKEQPWGQKMFSVKDPFGFKIGFGQDIEGFQHPTPNQFCGMMVDVSRGGAVLEELITHLRGFGLSRRASKKYAKLWLKNLAKSR